MELTLVTSASVHLSLATIRVNVINGWPLKLLNQLEFMNLCYYWNCQRHTQADTPGRSQKNLWGSYDFVTHPQIGSCSHRHLEIAYSICWAHPKSVLKILKESIGPICGMLLGNLIH